MPTYLNQMQQAAPKMLASTCRAIWWPFMAPDINAFAKKCKTCEVLKPSDPTELVLTHDSAQYRFQFIHMDVSQVEGHYYTVIIDQYLGYLHIHDCGKTATTKQVINATIKLIQHFSVPKIVYLDGGPQLLKDEDFEVFCRELGISHILWSHYMNGIAKACVKEIKFSSKLIFHQKAY
jgi:hypothetical protein